MKMPVTVIAHLPNGDGLKFSIEPETTHAEISFELLPSGEVEVTMRERMRPSDV